MTSTWIGRSRDVGAMAHPRAKIGITSQVMEVAAMVYNVACELQIPADAMRDQDWRGLDDEALGRLLVERWLYRGLLLGLILVAAIVVTYTGARGLRSPVDYVTLAVAVAVGLAAAA